VRNIYPAPQIGLESIGSAPVKVLTPDPEESEYRNAILNYEKNT
jgi:hypothetical protein